jgi:hypothetical protein
MTAFTYDHRDGEARAAKAAARTGCRHTGRWDDHCPCEDEIEEEDE